MRLDGMRGREGTIDEPGGGGAVQRDGPPAGRRASRGMEPTYAHCVHNVFRRTAEGFLVEAADVFDSSFERSPGSGRRCGRTTRTGIATSSSGRSHRDPQPRTASTAVDGLQGTGGQ